MIFEKILSCLENELHRRYEISSTIRHRGEKGKQREHGLSAFLKDYLPSAYGVATGELISIDGKNLSPQCDIIIFNSLITPIIGKYDAVQQVLINGVYCVIEVKSSLTKTTLKDAEQKFKKIRKLIPSESNQDNKISNPTFFLFGYKLETSVSAIKKFIMDHSQDEDISIVALDTGMTIWVGPEDKSVPAKAMWVPGTDLNNGVYSTLTLLYASILEVCQTTELPRFDFKKSILGL